MSLCDERERARGCERVDAVAAAAGDRAACCALRAEVAHNYDAGTACGAVATYLTATTNVLKAASATSAACICRSCYRSKSISCTATTATRSASAAREWCADTCVPRISAAATSCVINGAAAHAA